MKSRLGVATKTWMALEEALKESDGSEMAMNFECMICFVSKCSNRIDIQSLSNDLAKSTCLLAGADVEMGCGAENLKLAPNAGC